jgi:hypothetical protein
MTLIPGILPFDVCGYDALGTAPAAVPVAIASTNPTGTSFTATWGSAAAATGYRIDVNTASDFTGTALVNNVNAGNVLSYNVTGITLGTTVYWRVRAYNDSGTSANSNVITYARYNLLRQTQVFNNAFWAKTGGTTVTANSTTAPDGTTTADTINMVDSIYGAGNQGASSLFTVDVYFKKGNTDWIAMYGPSANGLRAWFNLNTGSLGNVTAGFTADITSAGSGWYRCRVSNTVAQAFNYCQFTLVASNGSTTPVTGTVYAWGAQGVIGAQQPYQQID